MHFLIILFAIALIIICLKSSKINREKTSLERKLDTITKDFLSYKKRTEFLKKEELMKETEEELEKLVKQMEYVVENANKEVGKRQEEFVK